MSTITTINGSDAITDSRTVINTNFSNLNTDKIETSYLDTDTTLAANSDTKIPSQKAVKTYIDTSGGANASETARGIVEEATDAEVTAGTATGGTGAKLIITPAKLATRLTATALNPVVRVYTSSDTWTKPSGLKYVEVEVVGGGSGGGGSSNNNGGRGAGGGGGGYSRKIVAVASLGATETVTVGAAGAAGTSTGAGSAGGNSIFGAHATANAGSGGAAGDTSPIAGGSGGTSASGDVNISGQQGGDAAAAGTTTSSGAGGSSVLGLGGASKAVEGAGIAGSGYGAGGSGGSRSTSSYGGGAGTAGIVIVTEHYI